MDLPQHTPDEAQLLRDYADYMLHELGRSPKTLLSYTYSLRRARQIVNKPLAELDVEDLRKIKRERSLAAATKSLMLTSCKSFHAWGALEGHWQLKPLSAIKSFPRKKVAGPAVSPQQARVLLGACRTPYEHRLIYLGLYAGCRIHESAYMAENNWQEDRLVFIGKGSKQRIVPIHRELQRVKHIILSATPASEGVMQAVMERLRRRIAAVDESGHPVRSHSLRRTFAVSLYERYRVPREVVATLLGHDDSVTALYAPVRYHILREAVDKLGYYNDIRRNNRRMVAEILTNGGIEWRNELVVGR